MNERDDEIEVTEADAIEDAAELRHRHKKVAELTAQGLSVKKIAEMLDYTENNIRVIQRRPEVRIEIQKYQEKFYEDTVAARIKQLANPALDVVEDVLNDVDQRQFGGDQRAITARWTVEQVNGKAIQKHKHELGEDMLSTMLDRLDEIKRGESERYVGSIDAPVKSLATSPLTTEEQEIKDWAMRFSKSKA